MEVWVFADGEATERLPENLGGDGGADLVVAADGGLRRAQKLGVQADVVVGDMDSADGAALAEAKAGETLPLGTSRGISNEMTGTQAEVSLEGGTLLVIMNS